MRDEQRNRDEPEASDAIGSGGVTDAELVALRLLQGTQVFGRDGTRLGMVRRDGLHDGYLFMRRTFGTDELALPESEIVLRDATGVYTDLT